MQGCSSQAHALQCRQRSSASGSFFWGTASLYGTADHPCPLREGIRDCRCKRGGLRLGPELSSLAGATQYNIVEHCRLLLNKLTQKTGETTDLAVMRGTGKVFLDQVSGTHRLTTVLKTSEVFPLTTTANGKACLAHLPEDDAIKLATNEWTRTGAQADTPGPLKELKGVRRNWLAYDPDEHATGVSAIGFTFTELGG